MELDPRGPVGDVTSTQLPNRAHSDIPGHLNLSEHSPAQPFSSCSLTLPGRWALGRDFFLTYFSLVLLTHLNPPASEYNCSL